LVPPENEGCHSAVFKVAKSVEIAVDHSGSIGQVGIPRAESGGMPAMQDFDAGAVLVFAEKSRVERMPFFPSPLTFPAFAKTRVGF
jgi:hypothetical protein